MKCNILSIGQVIEKVYNIHMETKAICAMDENIILALKDHMAPSRNLKVELKVLEHRYVLTAAC